jgi:hypothetical protein
MSATRAQINWASVTFGSTAITRITTGGFGHGGKLLRFKGDTDMYSTVIANVTNEPSATFTTADVGTMMGIAPGTTNTLSATLNDAKGATGGAVVFTMINAVFENADTTAQHAQFGTVTGTWQAFSSDGATNPLSFTRV